MLSYTLDEYLTKDLFQLLGLESITDVQKQELINDMSQTVTARVYAHVYETLTPEEQQELDEIEPEKVIAFFESRGFDLPKMLSEEAMRYRLELIHVFEMATAPLESSSVASQPA